MRGSRKGARFHTEREATGYLAMEIAARCIDSLQKHVPPLRTPHERLVGALRHDLPLDMLAGLLMELARDAGKPCGCQPDEDGALYHYCKPTHADRARAWIEKLQAGPAAMKPEDANNGREAPACLHRE